MKPRAARLASALALLVGLAVPSVQGSTDAHPGAARVAGWQPAAWREQGSGEARWLGLSLYRASLLRPADEEGPWSAERPHALRLVYARGFSARQIAEASLDEIRRLALLPLDGEEAARWQARLEALFPDVAEGDELVGVHWPGQGIDFHHHGRLLGRIDDPAFARAFMAIWLDPRTRLPALRARLIGEPQDG